VYYFHNTNFDWCKYLRWCEILKDLKVGYGYVLKFQDLGVTKSLGRQVNFHGWWNQDSSVGIVTGYRLDSQGLIPDRGKKFFSSPQGQTGSEGHTTSYPIKYWGSFPGGKVARALN
jgi:hypothetical protein